MFDDALLESHRKRFATGRRVSLPVAVGFHALVIGAFVGASAWFTGDAPEPAIPIVFPAPPSAAAVPFGGGEIHRATPHSQSRASQAMVQPVLPRVEEARPAVLDEIESSQALTEPSDPGPGGPGLPTGDPYARGPFGVDPVGTGRSEEILHPGGDVVAPVLLLRVEPAYPEAARRARLEGPIVLEAIITASGDVEEIRVVQSANPLLDEAAERAVHQWRYRPATLNGRAVRVYLTVTVRFDLRS